MKFQKYLIITGTDIRTKRDGSPYYLLHILMDNGQTCSLPYKGDIMEFNKIDYMKKYLIDFEISFSQYGTRIDVLTVKSESK